MRWVVLSLGVACGAPVPPPSPSAGPSASASVTSEVAETPTSEPLPSAVAEPAPAPGLPTMPVAKTIELPPAPSHRGPVVPTLTANALASSPEPMGLFDVDGAVLVTDRDRVGRVLGDRVLWFTKLPPPTPMYGEHRAVSIQGRFPFRLDLIYRTTNRAAPLTSYQPLTGPGQPHRSDYATGTTYYPGVAEIGPSTVVLFINHMFPESTGAATVRGPKRTLSQQHGGEAQCKPGEHPHRRIGDHVPDLEPILFGATRGGTAVAVGALCGTRGIGAEVWGADGSSHIHDLQPLLVGSIHRGGAGTMLAGADDDLWIFVGGFNPIVRFRNGSFEALPLPEQRIEQVFLSDDGELFAATSRALLHLVEGAWAPVGAFATPTSFDAFATVGNVVYAARDKEVFRLAASGEQPVELGCPHPWLYLGDEGWGDDDVPHLFERFEATTREAVRGFPDGERFVWNAVTGIPPIQTRVGLRAPNRESATAMARHLKAEVPGLRPQLSCLTPVPKKFVKDWGNRTP